MSKRGLLLLVVASLTTAVPAGAQSAAALRDQLAAVQARRTAAYQRMARAEQAARAVPDDSLMLHGAIVRFRSAHLSARDRIAIARAFDAAAAELADAFGADGAALLARDQWLISFADGNNRFPVAEFKLLNESQRVAVNLPFPLRGDALQRLVATRAASSVATQSPVIAAWLGYRFSVENPERMHYFAYRQLVFHATPAGQRCARGAVSDCSTMLGVGVSQSILRYAIERDGPAMLAMMQSAPDVSKRATESIATALGESEVDLLSAWHAQIASSGEVRAKGSKGLLLTSFGWCALCAVAAARRRPR